MLEPDQRQPDGVEEGQEQADQALAAQLMDENARLREPREAGEVLREALIRSALDSAARAVELGLPADRIVLSAKVSGVQELIAVYRELARRGDYALHLGLTEAGIGSKGIVASAAALAVLQRVMPIARDLRRGGAASLDLAYVAAGRLDGYYERGLSPWDHAAGALLVQEAGGRIAWHPADETGRALIVAAGPAVFDALDRVVREDA